MRNAKLRGCRKPATYAKTLSITKISTLHLELRGDPTRSVPGSAGLATVTTCFPFGYGVNLASVTSPHNLGFHPYSKEVRSLGHLEVFTNCAPGRKGKKEENIASEQRCDIMIPQRHQHHNPSTLMPHRQGAELGGGKPVAPSGRKGRRTASSPDTPPPPHPPFPGHSGLPRPHPGWAEQGALLAVFTLVTPTPTTNTRFRSRDCEADKDIVRTTLGTGGRSGRRACRSEVGAD